MTQSTRYTVILLVLVVLSIAGAFAYRAYYKQDTVPTGTDTPATTTPITVGLIDGLPEGTTVTVTDRLDANLYDKTPQPTLSRELPRGIYNAEQYAILEEKRKGAVAAITANPAAMSNWIGLGILHKQVGDYEGARIYWSYVTTVNSTNLIAHWNLATLYELYLKDSLQAEKEFKAVISLDKAYIPAYTELATIYVNAGENEKALALLSSGLSANSGAIDLVIARAHLYRTLGKITEARADYNRAITLAQTAKNTGLVATLTTERDALK